MFVQRPLQRMVQSNRGAHRGVDVTSCLGCWELSRQGAQVAELTRNLNEAVRADKRLVNGTESSTSCWGETALLEEYTSVVVVTRDR